MNRFAPYARPPFQSGGLVRFISKPPLPDAKAPELISAESEIKEVECTHAKKVVELTNKILSCEKELDIPGVERMGEQGGMYRISMRYMGRNEFSTELELLSLAADEKRGDFFDLDGDHPEDSKAFAEAIFGDNSQALLEPNIYDAAIAYRHAVIALDLFVLRHVPVDIDAFRLKILRLSDTISRSLQELRQLQAIGVEIGTAILT
jgi:hypothetical protein